MTLLDFVKSSTVNDRNHKMLDASVSIFYVVLTVVALFLAIRDMGALSGTTSKLWLFCLAVFIPELYVILHGLSSASMGVGFFSDAMIDLQSLTPSTHAGSSLSPHDVGATLSSAAERAGTAVKHGLGKAAHKMTTAADTLSTELSGYTGL